MVKKTKKRAGLKSQATLQALLVCEGASRSPDGKLTLYGIFDRLNVEDLKGHVSFWVYAKIKGTGTHEFSIDVVDRTGKSVFKDDERPSIEKNLKGGGLQMQLQMVIGFKKSGPFRVVFKAGRKLLGEYPIHIAKKAKGKH